MNDIDSPLSGDLERIGDGQVSTVPQKPAEPAFGEIVEDFINTAGQLETTDRQNDILTAPIEEGDVQIIPDSVGMIYLPWHWYAQRLNKAFGIGQWTLVPEGKPNKSGFPPNELMLWGFHLIIQGNYCGYAMGEQKMVASGGRMTYGDCIEGSRSNALSRLCKHLGMAPDLWDKRWADSWKEQFAERKNIRGTLNWARKGESAADLKKELDDDLKALYGDKVSEGILELTSAKMKNGDLVGGKSSLEGMKDGELYMLAKKLKKIKETKILTSGGVKAEKEGGEKEK